MKEGELFFDNTEKDLDQEIAEIDLRKYHLILEPLVPGEEVVGNINDHERKILIWISLMEEKINQTQLSVSDLKKVERIEQYEIELEIIKEKFTRCLRYIAASFTKRFGYKSLAIRGNGSVVLPKESEMGKVLRMENLQKSSTIGLSSFSAVANFKQ